MTQLAMDSLTLGHVAITLIGIVTGLIVVSAMTRGHDHAGWTAAFLLFTVLTSATGFLFHNPTGKPTPAQIVGAISLAILALALVAYYIGGRRGVWRPLYVVTAILALYLNVFVLVIQLFLKVPSLHALAPAGSGPVFGAAQGVVLLIFLAAGWLGLKNFRPALA